MLYIFSSVPQTSQYAKSHGVEVSPDRKDTKRSRKASTSRDVFSDSSADEEAEEPRTPVTRSRTGSTPSKSPASPLPSAIPRKTGKSRQPPNVKKGTKVKNPPQKKITFDDVDSLSGDDEEEPSTSHFTPPRKKKCVKEKTSSVESKLAKKAASAGPKTYTLDFDEEEEDEENPGPADKGPKRKREREYNPVVQVLKERSGMLQKMSDTVMSLSNTADKDNDVDVLWAKTIAHHMKRMPQTVRDRFSVFVLQTAFDAIDGKWP